MAVKRLNYLKSGVNINAARAFVSAIKRDVSSTQARNVLKRKSAFGGLFSFDSGKYRNPILVSSTDGVGTKLLIAQWLGKHNTVGIDLVAMNINDILCTGAKPLFFLDYIACGKIQPRVLKSVVSGIVKGCQLCGLSLIGGETAEMPGMYDKDEYDLAGFAVGVVERGKIIDGSKIKKGDCLIGLPSSGLHSNGYSLVREVFSKGEQKKMASLLLKPTRIYAKEVLSVIKKFQLHGIAHMTGGAFYEKLTKILPKGKCFVINKRSWPQPIIFQKIQKRGRIIDSEMYRTFNMGIGLVIVVGQRSASPLMSFLKRKKIKYYKIGEVINHPKKRIIL